MVWSLSTRQENILELIVSEYIATATPVGSRTIVQKHGLGVSPATVRLQMAQLEEGGYISHPHTSAGRIPLDKGYRYYIDSLMAAAQLPPAQQRHIRYQLHKVQPDIEQWARLAGALLASLVGNAVLVTPPKASQSRFKHLELVLLHEFLALLIIVLNEARVSKTSIPLEETTTQDKLSALAMKLNMLCCDQTRHSISERTAEVALSPVESRITRAVLQTMQAEEEQEYEEPLVEGLRHFFSQPEFSSRKRMLSIMELFEDKVFLRALLARAVAGEEVRVIIGGENPAEEIRDCSMVVVRYGVAGNMAGAIGVLGPTRMPYDRTIAAVRCLALALDELLEEILQGRASFTAQPEQAQPFAEN